jgi:hypothetical protein
VRENVGRRPGAARRTRRNGEQSARTGEKMIFFRFRHGAALIGKAALFISSER